MKALVPSIGSSTQTYSASGRVGAELLADDAVPGELGLDHPPHRHLGGAVGLGDGIEAPALALVLGAEGAAEERQDRLPGRVAELLDEGCEINGGHRVSSG